VEEPKIEIERAYQMVKGVLLMVNGCVRRLLARKLQIGKSEIS